MRKFFIKKVNFRHGSTVRKFLRKLSCALRELRVAGVLQYK